MLMRIALKLGVVLRYQEDLPAAEVVLREAAQLAQQRRDNWALAEARRALTRVYSLLGKPERAHENIHQALKAALALGDPQLLCECYLELADLVAKTGGVADAAQELEEGILLVTQGDGPAVEHGPQSLPRLLVRLAEIRAAAGSRQAAEKLVGHALRLAEDSTEEAGRAKLRALAAQVMHAAGQHEEAARLRRLAVTELRNLGDRRATAEQLLVLADEDDSLDADRRAWLLEAERLSTQMQWTQGSDRSRQRLASLT
jgi:tetratricopeptide (TPR) repeat protein